MPSRWSRRLALTVLFSVVATGLMAPLASNTIVPELPDLPFHISASWQARLALAEGQFPLRVAPREREGRRYAAFQLYGQFPYTVAAVLQKVALPDTPQAPYVALKVVVWGSLVMGGLYLYRLRATSAPATRRRLTSVDPVADQAGVRTPRPGMLRRFARASSSICPTPPLSTTFDAASAKPFTSAAVMCGGIESRVRVPSHTSLHDSLFFTSRHLRHLGNLLHRSDHGGEVFVAATRALAGGLGRAHLQGSLRSRHRN